MPESEFILLRRFASNDDAEAFSEIIKQHASLVHGVCLRILEDKDKAADAVQETFLQLVRDAAEITGSLPNWLHRVATHKAINIIRTDSQRKQREEKYAADSKKNQAKDNLQIWQEISGCIDKELDQLDDLTREVLILHFFEGQTMTNIAEKFGISQPTVSRRIESGVASLRHKLNSHGVIVPAAMLTVLLTENIVKAAPASIMKELGKLALAGGETAATTGAKITAVVSVAKTKILVGASIALLGIGSIVFISVIANGQNKPESSAANTTKAVSLDINQILRKFSQARENINSFIAESEQECKYKWENKEWGEKHEGIEYIRTFYACDGKRIKTKSELWGNLSPRQTNVSESNPDFSASLWDGKRHYSYTQGYLILTNPEDVQEKTPSARNTNIERGMGYMRGEEKRIDELLMENLSQVKLRTTTENINGFDCYVIDADIKGDGEYHIWIDPEHDNGIVKMQIYRSEGDVSFDNVIEKGNFANETYEVASFEKYGDLWFPKEYKVTSEKTTYGNPRSEERTVKYKYVDFNPDFDVLDIFKPDFVKNGAKVDVPGVDGLSFTWKDGGIVDNDGEKIDPFNLKPVTLIGKSLPDLEKYLVKIDPEFIRNKMLLICFWDMENTQSVNCIKTLNKRANALLDNNLYIVFIHAGLKPVLENKLYPWINKNDILPPVGASRYGMAEIGYNWGVKSIPWLILTDKKHIVTDEGFSLNELDEKIAASRER